MSSEANAPQQFPPPAPPAGEDLWAVPIVAFAILTASYTVYWILYIKKSKKRNGILFCAASFNLFAQVVTLAELLVKFYSPPSVAKYQPFVRVLVNVCNYTGLYFSCLVSIEILKVFSPLARDVLSAKKILYFSRFMTGFFVFTAIWPSAFSMMLALLGYISPPAPMVMGILLTMSVMGLYVWFVFVVVYQIMQSFFVTHLVYKYNTNANQAAVKNQFKKTLSIVGGLALFDIGFIFMFQQGIQATLYSYRQVAILSVFSAMIGTHIVLLIYSLGELAKLVFAGSNSSSDSKLNKSNVNPGSSAV
jgi:hypothetical protein